MIKKCIFIIILVGISAQQSFAGKIPNWMIFLDGYISSWSTINHRDKLGISSFFIGNKKCFEAAMNGDGSVVCNKAKVLTSCIDDMVDSHLKHRLPDKEIRSVAVLCMAKLQTNNWRYKSQKPNPVTSNHTFWTSEKTEKLSWLLAVWHEQDEQCRGGSGDNQNTQNACEARYEAYILLGLLDWCLVKEGEFDNQHKWHKCESNSIKPLPSIGGFGKTIQKDISEAEQAEFARWVRKAAKKGNTVAAFYLGALHFTGQGVPQNYTKSEKWLRKAAEKGIPRAMFYLGVLHFTGQGVPQNFTKAEKWYRKAAEKGILGAMAGLGLMYATGQGVQENFAEAAKWYRKAAEKGDAEGMLSLGHLYGIGKGIMQDYVLAHMWTNLAAARGHAEATKLRSDLAKIMTHEQIAKAQRLARQWKPK